MGAKPRDILKEMIHEAQRLQEEFAQSSAVDSVKVCFAALALLHCCRLVFDALIVINKNNN